MKIREKLRDIFYIRKPWWRFPLAIGLILIILAGGALAYKFVSAAQKVIVKGISSSLAGNRLGISQLKGESEGRVNVLFLGVGVEGQSGSDLTDTIMLASFDMKNHNVSLISIPRDLYIKIPEVGYSKINTAYEYGNKIDYNGGGGGLARDTVSNILGVPIHYYVAMDFDGFKEIIDTLGGIDIKVDKSIYDYNYPCQNERGKCSFILEKGDYHMDGALTLKYVRSRQSTSDFDRARRQQQVLVAIKDKAFEKQIIMNPKKVYDLYNALSSHLKTDFQMPEIGRVVELAQDFKIENIDHYVFDDNPDGFLNSDQVGGAYVIKPQAGDFAEVQKFVKYFITQEPAVKKENASIEIKNGSGRDNLATTLSNKLKKYSLNITGVGSADRYDYTESVIYDRSNSSKPATVSFLADYLSAKVIKQDKGQGQTTEPDITVIIGQNYVQN